jgi:hypothetical protein
MSFNPYKFLVTFQDLVIDPYPRKMGIFLTRKEAENRKIELMASLNPKLIECKIIVWWCPDTEV